MLSLPKRGWPQSPALSREHHGSLMVLLLYHARSAAVAMMGYRISSLPAFPSDSVSVGRGLRCIFTSGSLAAPAHPLLLALNPHLARPSPSRSSSTCCLRLFLPDRLSALPLFADLMTLYGLFTTMWPMVPPPRHMLRLPLRPPSPSTSRVFPPRPGRDLPRLHHYYHHLPYTLFLPQSHYLAPI